jgi:multidrug efflux pump subunit AcrA (membrane-fusion protein)
MVLRADCPVLVPGTKISRTSEDGKVRYVVRAGHSGKYIRVGEAEEMLLSLMDGSRTVEEIRTSYIARRKEPIDLAEVSAFVKDMRARSVVDETAEGKNLVLLEKARQRRKERLFAGKFGALFFYRVPLLDPDSFVTRLERHVRFFFTRTFVVFAASLVVLAALTLWANRSEVLGRVKDFGLITAGSGMGIVAVWLTALSVVCIHEMGHGVTCKHFGGDVHEMGFLLLFFQPCFYCNVNDAWTFESRAARLWVTAAGGFIEITLGSFCVLVWAATEPGSAVHGIAYLVFMISLSSSLLFNMNPLIKLDGYYLLADILKIENLRDRAYQQLGWLVRGKIFRRPAQRAATDMREAWILSLYAILSSIYTGLIIVTLLTVLARAMFEGSGPGLPMLGFLSFICWMMLKRPLKAVGGAVGDVAKSKMKTLGPRAFWGRCGAAAGGVAIVAMLVPWTRTSTATGHLEAWRLVEIRAPLEGVVAEVLVGEGQRVEVGTPLFRMDAPVEEASSRAASEQASRMRRDALRRRAAGDAAGAEAAEKDARAAEIGAMDTEERLTRRTIPSPIAGLVETHHIEEMKGAPVGRHAPLAKVGDCSRVHVHALMDARAVGPVREGQDARIHLRSYIGTPLEGKVVSVSRQPLDEKDTRMKDVTGPHWEVVVEAPNPGLALYTGMTGEVSVLVERTTIAGAFLKEIRGTVRTDLLR